MKNASRKAYLSNFPSFPIEIDLLAIQEVGEGSPTRQQEWVDPVSKFGGGGGALSMPFYVIRQGVKNFPPFNKKSSCGGQSNKIELYFIYIHQNMHQEISWHLQ